MFNFVMKIVFEKSTMNIHICVLIFLLYSVAFFCFDLLIRTLIEFRIFFVFFFITIIIIIIINCYLLLLIDTTRTVHVFFLLLLDVCLNFFCLIFEKNKTEIMKEKCTMKILLQKSLNANLKLFNVVEKHFDRIDQRNFPADST